MSSRMTNLPQFLDVLRDACSPANKYTQQQCRGVFRGGVASAPPL